MKVEAGLGESEFFYSLLISAINFGAAFGGLTNGFLIRIIPYWYLWAVALVAQTVSYVIYCVALQSWLMVISRLLAGYFIGSITTIGFSYFTDTSVLYTEELKKLERDIKQADFRVRNYLFATFNIGLSIGLIIGSGKL